MLYDWNLLFQPVLFWGCEKNTCTNGEYMEAFYNAEINSSYKYIGNLGFQ